MHHYPLYWDATAPAPPPPRTHTHNRTPLLLCDI